MVTVTRTFTVDKPVEVVVDYKNFSNAEQWDPGTQRCTRQDSGPIGVGATWLNVSKVLGRETRLTYRLDRLEANRVTFVGTNKTATSTDDITVIGAGTGSKITYTAEIRFDGAAKLAEPLMKLVFERLGNATERQLSDAVARL